MAEERRRRLIGQVVSDKMEKTIVVDVRTTRQHPLYGKTIRVSKRFKAHDENNTCRVGDQVKIVECRPMSKDKHWCLEEIIQRAEQIDTTPITGDVVAPENPAQTE